MKNATVLTSSSRTLQTRALQVHTRLGRCGARSRASCLIDRFDKGEPLKWYHWCYQQPYPKRIKLLSQAAISTKNTKMFILLHEFVHANSQTTWSSSLARSCGVQRTNRPSTWCNRRTQRSWMATRQMPRSQVSARACSRLLRCTSRTSVPSGCSQKRLGRGATGRQELRTGIATLRS